MSNKWHLTENKKPKKDQVVIGFWFREAIYSADICFYDTDTRQWFGLDRDDLPYELESPKYWIETPE